MSLLALGLDHTTAPVKLREQVAFSAELVRDALKDLRARLPALVQESAILSTCNRTELYCAVREPLAARAGLLEWLGHAGMLAPDKLRPHVYALPQHEAVRHAFRVASGLESMVIGEPQILGQMKQAARQAQEVGVLGTVLHRLFQRSFEVAKEVRSQTGIGAGSVSLAAATVHIAQRVFSDLRDTRVLFIGAGRMIELAATHFNAQHPQLLMVANRTHDRADRLAKRFGAHTMELAQLPARLHEFDIVVSCTASSLPVIGLGMVEKASQARQSRPLLMLDLAVPRDIEPEAGRLHNVFLYSIDDLGRFVRAGLTSRRASTVHAEAIIEKGVDSFLRWMGSRGTAPLLRTLDRRAGEHRLAELERARRLIARGDPVDRVLESLAMGLSNKLLHAPRILLSSNTLSELEARQLVDRFGNSRQPLAPLSDRTALRGTNNGCN
jgi:glutamyl-tRNA reductase